MHEELLRIRQIAGLLGISLVYHNIKLVSYLIDREEGVIEHRVSQLLARRLLRHLKMQVDVSGLEHVPSRGRYCVICNHVSYLDWAVLLGHFPSPLRFIGKKELLYVPVVGSFLRARAVLIDRSKGRDALTAIRAATRDEQPWPILLFPEGTRSPTGELQRFKPGGISVLAEAGLPMVPVGIWGTHEAFPRRAKTIKTGARLRMAVTAPIDPGDYPELPALVAALHDRILATRRSPTIREAGAGLSSPPVRR